MSRRTNLLLIGLALLVAVASGAGLVYQYTRPDAAPKPAVAATQAANALRDADAASMKLNYFDQGGLDVTGDLTVTKNGVTSGTLTDSGGGKADYVVVGDKSAVRGDQGWWARRDPARVGILKNTWVRPQSFALPIADSGLDPAALAGMVDWVRNGGASADDVTTVAGQPVVGMRRDGWTVLFSRAKPYRLVWFGGPLQNGTPIAPLAESGPPTPPYVSALVAPSPSDVKNVAFPKNALVEEKAAAKLPAFDVTVNASTCRTSTCSWTVTVTNTGTAPGTVSVIASVAPGMTKTQVESLGKLAPGETSTTAKMTFPNPAPTNRDVTADYRAQVYAPELYGSNLKLLQTLEQKGIVPGRSPVLGKLDPSQTGTMLLTLDAMSGARDFDPDKALEAMEKAVALGVLPELAELVRSKRVENPEILYSKMQNLIFEYDTAMPGSPITEKTGSRRQLQIAAGVLREDPDAIIRLDADPVDLLVHTSQQRVYSLQIRTVSSDSFDANVRDALPALGKAPAGSVRVVLLYVEAPAGFAHAAGRDYFQDRLDGLSKDLCNGNAEEVVVVNQTGVQKWAKEQYPGC